MHWKNLFCSCSKLPTVHSVALYMGMYAIPHNFASVFLSTFLPGMATYVLSGVGIIFYGIL